MSKSLYRLGHLAARRPWVVIGSWLVLAVVVVGASGAFGHRLKDSMQVPGLDSQQASELMAAAGASDAGLTAQVVVTPLDDDATFVDSAEARVCARQAAERRRGAAPRPQDDGGRVAGRARRADPPAVPARGRALSPGPQQPQGVRCRGRGGVPAAARDGWRPLLRVRAAAARRGRAHRAAGRGAHPLPRLRVADRHGPPARHRGARTRRRCQLHVT